MSITIGDLKYRNNTAFLHDYIKDNFSWVRNFRVLDGWKGKAPMSNILLQDNVLVADPACDISAFNVTLDSKDIETVEYGITFPITLCELRNSWLTGFASKYKDVDEVFVDQLTPYVADKIQSQMRTIAFAGVLAEAQADADVDKVAVASGISTPALAYASVLEFIEGLPIQFLHEAIDSDSWDGYTIYVSPELATLVAIHLSDKGGNGFFSRIGGFRIQATQGLVADAMIASRDGNLLLVMDDLGDMNKVRVTYKEEISTHYIQCRVSFKGSYANSKDIVLSS